MLTSVRLFQVLLLSVAAICVGPTVCASEVSWSADIASALQESRSTGRLVLMKFTADWCHYCKKMERTTFSDPAMAELVNRDFVPVLIDFAKHQELAAHLKIRGLPVLLVVSPDLKIIERINGYHTAPKLFPKLQTVLAQNQTSEKLLAHTASQTRTAVSADELDPSVTEPFRWSGSAGTAVVDDDHVSDENPFVRVDSSAEVNPFAEVDPFTEIESHSAAAEWETTAPNKSPAFNGLCIISVVQKRAVVMGTPEHSLVYRGRLLHFHDSGRRAAFQASPGRYWPRFDGSCVRTLLETGQHVPGRLEYAAIFRNQIWLFSSREKMKAFIASPTDTVGRLEIRGLIN